MTKLIEALNIFLKYGNPRRPTICDHDVMYVMIDPELVSKEDKIALEALGFDPNPECDNFMSYEFGSA